MAQKLKDELANGGRPAPKSRFNPELISAPVYVSDERGVACRQLRPAKLTTLINFTAPNRRVPYSAAVRAPPRLGPAREKTKLGTMSESGTARDMRHVGDGGRGAAEVTMMNSAAELVCAGGGACKSHQHRQLAS